MERSAPSFRRRPAGRARRPGLRRRGRRAVSDVVATILILALTVVLFSALFAFVSRFPAPPAQSVNQFQASMIHTSTAVTGVSILLEGGPPVPSSDRIYLESTRSSTNWQFAYSPGIPVAWGTNNASAGWVTGAYWTTTFKTTIAMPVNITVYIVSSSQLLYEGVIPGIQPSVPPILTNTYTVPSTITVGANFQIFADVSGNTSGLTMNVSLGEIPGLTSTIETMAHDGSGVYVYNITSSAGTTTKNGTYLAFVQGVNATGSTIAGSVSVTLVSSGSSGSSNPSATVSFSPNPATVRTNASLVASISNPTAASLTVSNVTFYVNYTTNNTNAKTLYPPSTTTLPTIASGKSAAVSSTVWMIPPNAAVSGGENLTVRVSFSSGAHTTGSSQTSFGVAPFTAYLTTYSQNATAKTNGTWIVLVNIANSGNLGSNTVNVTVYVNNTTGAKAAVGYIISPGGTKGSSAGVGYCTVATQTLGPSTTGSYVCQWRLGGASTRGASTLSLQAVVTVKNTLWNSFTTTTLTLTKGSTPAITAVTFTT